MPGLNAKKIRELTPTEREKKLGGLLPLASLIKGTYIEDIPSIIKYLKSNILKSEVKTYLGRNVDRNLVKEINPDTVIFACGGDSSLPNIRGIGSKKVINHTLLQKRASNILNIFGPRFLYFITNFYLPIGKRVAIIGGSIEGCEFSEFLIKRGRKVTIIEKSHHLGEGMPLGFRSRFIKWFNEKGGKFYLNVNDIQVTKGGLQICQKDKNTSDIIADSILFATGLEPSQLPQQITDDDHNYSMPKKIMSDIVLHSENPPDHKAEMTVEDLSKVLVRRLGLKRKESKANHAKLLESHHSSSQKWNGESFSWYYCNRHNRGRYSFYRENNCCNYVKSIWIHCS